MSCLYLVTVRQPGGPWMYFRGGARMYANRTEDAAAFLTLADAQSAAEDLRKLLLHLPGRDYRVGTLQISRQKKKGGAA